MRVFQIFTIFRLFCKWNVKFSNFNHLFTTFLQLEKKINLTILPTIFFFQCKIFKILQFYLQPFYNLTLKKTFLQLKKNEILPFYLHLFFNVKFSKFYNFAIYLCTILKILTFYTFFNVKFQNFTFLLTFFNLKFWNLTILPTTFFNVSFHNFTILFTTFLQFKRIEILQSYIPSFQRKVLKLLQLLSM